MIVKIGFNKEWVIYDGFEKVHYKHLRLRHAEPLDTNARWLEEGKRNDHICVHISARKIQPNEDKIGSSFSIIATGFVFLCNDEGKTIERIN